LAHTLLVYGYAAFLRPLTYKEYAMFGWSISFLIIAIIAGIFGFSGIAGTAVGVAKILFVVGLVMFLVTLVAGRHTPPL